MKVSFNVLQKPAAICLPKPKVGIQIQNWFSNIQQHRVNVLTVDLNPELTVSWSIGTAKKCSDDIQSVFPYIHWTCLNVLAISFNVLEHVFAATFLISRQRRSTFNYIFLDSGPSCARNKAKSECSEACLLLPDRYLNDYNDIQGVAAYLQWHRVNAMGQSLNVLGLVVVSADQIIAPKQCIDNNSGEQQQHSMIDLHIQEHFVNALKQRLNVPEHVAAAWPIYRWWKKIATTFRLSFLTFTSIMWT